MSYQAVSAVLTHSRSTGSDRLVLLVLASHADEEGFECYPGRDLLCKEAAMSERNLIRCLNSLEELKEITLDRGNGRGRGTTYKINLGVTERVTQLSPFPVAERVTNSAQRVTESVKRVTPVVKKGDKSGFACKEEPSLTKKKPSENHVGATAPDPRTAHAAIQTCRNVAKAYPPKELWDKLIQVLGETPNTTLLVECRAEWVERGYNRASWKWATEWYATGVPARTIGSPPKQSKGAYVGATKPNGGKQVNAEDLAFMEEYIDGLIAANDLTHLADEYNRIVEDGGAKAEWEIRCCAWYELHKMEMEK